MTTAKIVAFAGSTRKDSFNKKLIRVAADAANSAGAEVTLVDLKDYPLPLYDGDLEDEQGVPEKALELKEIFKAADALMIASPEYNSSLTGVLKNTIDWISRPSREEVPQLVAFWGKSAAIMSASPGALGGLRGLVHLRSILGNIGMLVIPDQHAVSQAHKVFDGEGNMTDESQKEKIEGIAKKLVTVVSKLKTE